MSRSNSLRRTPAFFLPRPGKPVPGVDATPDGLIAVKKGTLSATVFQDGAGQARGAIDTAIDAIHGKQHEQITWIPAELVTQDNLAAFEAKHKQG
jgi:inositol transport system substrate-binding protein